MLLPVLIVLLAIANAWVWSALSSSAMSYQSVSSEQQSFQQFEIAEYALYQAEQWLRAIPTEQLPAPVTFCVQRPCVLKAVEASYFPQQEKDWWEAANNLAVFPVSMDIPFLHTAFYAIEQLVESSSGASAYYRITSWALLDVQENPTVLQSIWMKSGENSEDKRNAWRHWGV